MPIEPRAAVAELLSRVAPVGSESLPLTDFAALAGRVLAEPVTLDRDSPSLDVSAMDGYAVRLDELIAGGVPLVGECRIGEAPATLAPGTARRIFTGSPLPLGADTVVRLERAELSGESLRLLDESRVPRGADIRRQGENASRGAPALSAGQPLTPAAIAALATIGPVDVTVRRPIRLTVITTGNELVRGSGAIDPWRLRDSNGPSLVAMLSGSPWVADVSWNHGADELAELTAALREALASSDAVVFTGGVSKGDYDLVWPAIEAAGGEQVFHRIAARPGQPTLGAVVDGKPVVGLPGNPLAVLCAGRRVLTPVLRKLAGFADPSPAAPQVKLLAWSGKTLSIAWWRPVRLLGDGTAEIVSLKGSGDVIGPAGSDGFIETPPGSDGPGPYAFYPWSD